MSLLLHFLPSPIFRTRLFRREAKTVFCNSVQMGSMIYWYTNTVLSARWKETRKNNGYSHNSYSHQVIKRQLLSKICYIKKVILSNKRCVDGLASARTGFWQTAWQDGVGGGRVVRASKLGAPDTKKSMMNFCLFMVFQPVFGPCGGNFKLLMISGIDYASLWSLRPNY
jgi:hypothetical protein